MKQCKACTQLKPIDCFTKDMSKSDYKSIYCKECLAEDYKSKRDPNILSIIEKREINKLRKQQGKPSRKKTNYNRYGITMKWYDDAFKIQDGRCAICYGVSDNKKSALCIDHCHTTNKVRGLLCNKCNLGLGHFKDNLDIMKSALLYLETYVELPSS